MDKKVIESKVIAYKTELEGNITNRRRDVIVKELHKLSSLLNEFDKNEKSKVGRKHKAELDELKADYEGQISSLVVLVRSTEKIAADLLEEKRINKLKAQNVFKKLNARLTPDEVKLFYDGLSFIRIFVNG